MRREFVRGESAGWALFTLCLGAIYASLPFARGIVIALRGQHLLGAAVTALFFAAAASLVYYLVFDVRLSDRVAFLALVLLAAAVGSLVLGLRVPEERIHFLEYGGLALLARHALSYRFRPAAQYAVALGLAAVAGWGDELLQGVLPERVYDLRDVAINAVAAFLALLGDEVLHNRLGWRRR